MLTVLGGIAGFFEGVVFFMISNFSLDAPSRVFVPGEWMGYPSLIFGGIGAICGAVLVWAVYSWATKQTYVSVPRRPSNGRDLPSRGPSG
jgi:hypothetical protein